MVYVGGVFVGYRYYEKTGSEVTFPSGHGLSYTSFEIKDLVVIDKGGNDDEVRVSVSVRNTGSRPCAQVIQVYVAQQNPSVNRPVMELKRFTKVYLDAGETKEASVSLSKEYAASFWDEERRRIGLRCWLGIAVRRWRRGGNFLRWERRPGGVGGNQVANMAKIVLIEKNLSGWVTG